MSFSYHIVSIGTLSRNRFWNETQNKRSAHSTTTLIRDGTTTILVDPGLPEQLLMHFLDERTGMTANQIDVVFLTNFRPVHRRALKGFDKAGWFMHKAEIEAMIPHLSDLADRSENEDPDFKRMIEDEHSLLKQIKPADEKLTPRVHLFPAPGATPGSAGLLLAFPSSSIVVAGDAVISQAYYENGRIFEQAVSIEQARESFVDILEVADEVIPGHDNIFSLAGR